MYIKFNFSEFWLTPHKAERSSYVDYDILYFLCFEIGYNFSGSIK